ncbi:MAG: hypothetical protein K6A28_00890 [Bacteroidales bacterium]|nr:hypothetical protein [Bacteroidales bacterium]
MKKVVLLAFAACLVFFAACNNGGKGGKTENVAIPETFATYDGAEFTIQYPGEMEVTWSDGFLNTRYNDGEAKLDAAFSDTPPTSSQLKEYASNLIYMMKNDGYTCGDPVVKKDCMTVRFEDESTIKHSFVVLSDKETGVAGNLTYNKELANTWDAYIAPIMASVKFK